MNIRELKLLKEIDGLTIEQQKGIIASIEQMQNGQGIPHAKVMKKFKDKYNLPS